MMKFKNVLVSSFLITTSLFIHKPSLSNVEIDTYKDYQAIPPVLGIKLRSNIFLESYISQMLQPIRRYSDNRNSLDHNEINKRVQKSIDRAEKKQLSRLVEHDINRDSNITKEEVKTFLIENHPNYVNPKFETNLTKMIDAAMANDHNGDGTISYQEMGTLTETAKNNVIKSKEIKQIKDYLELDPNNDEILTAQELKTLSKKAFYTIDLDRDSHISEDEYLKFNQAKRSYKQKSLSNVISTKCSFKDSIFPENLKVYGTGAYGGRRIGYQIDQSGHQARQIDIVVNEPNSSVALILGAYEPTIWNISHTPKTKISAVVAGGYHRQVFSGLDKSIPTLVSTREGDTPCGSFYFSENKFEKLNPIARSIFKKPADMFFPVDKNGYVVIGQKDFDSHLLISSKETPPESYKLENTLLAGQAGLAEAVRKGILRKAKESDKQAWIEKLIEKEKDTPTKDLPPMMGGNSIESNLPKMNFYNAYVVLKDFTYPAGLYGGNSATFIIAKGVNQPKGNRGHSTIYDLNTMQCVGTACRVE